MGCHLWGHKELDTTEHTHTHLTYTSPSFHLHWNFPPHFRSCNKYPFTIKFFFSPEYFTLCLYLLPYIFLAAQHNIN